MRACGLPEQLVGTYVTTVSPYVTRKTGVVVEVSFYTDGNLYVHVWTPRGVSWLFPEELTPAALHEAGEIHVLLTERGWLPE